MIEHTIVSVTYNNVGFIDKNEVIHCYQSDPIRSEFVVPVLSNQLRVGTPGLIRSELEVLAWSNQIRV